MTVPRPPSPRQLCPLLPAALYGLLALLGTPCLLRSLWGLPCPGCGMTRALMALLRLELWQALEYHPMVWSLPLIAAAILRDGRLTPWPPADRLVLASLGGGFFVCYLYRLSVCSIP